MRIYADNAATTKMSQTSIDAMTRAMAEIYGNPSSLHTDGQIASEALFEAREKIADILRCKPDQIYFTSGGSEADNQAIISAIQYGKRKNKKHIVTTTFEHHAVLHTLQKLEAQGYEVTYLNVHENGIIDLSELESAIRDDTALVTIMHANNEIGTIQPIVEIGRICSARKVLFHTDAVQTVGHLNIFPEEIGVDYLSASAHKFGGPKGIGFLYAKKKAYIHPLIEGGAQERGKRAGTENVPAIIAMAEALREASDNIDAHTDVITAMRNRLIEGLLEIPHSVLNGDYTNRLPGNVNICFEGIEGESLLLMLDMKGIAASSGSACTSGSLEPSHVLLAIGRPHEIAHGSLRLSINHENTILEIEKIIEVTKDVVTKLRSMSPVWDDLQKGRKEYVIQ